MVLTADKGVALVVADKDTYIEKCMTFLSEHRVYQKCRDLTKTIHNKVIKQLTNLKNSLSPELKNCIMNCGTQGQQYPVRFYGLPKIHKSDVPLRPIISACGTSTYKLSKFLQEFCRSSLTITSLLKIAGD